MAPLRIGWLYPGQMGASLARLAAAEGAQCYTSVSSRSERTQGLAKEAGCLLLDSEDQLLEEVDLILSVLRPDRALEVAKRVASRASRVNTVRCRFFVDLNAIAPRTVAEIADAFGSTSISAVDGGIQGPPAKVSPRSCPSIGLSGPHAHEVAAHLQPLFGSQRVRVIGDAIGQASALKMSYASINKGLLAIMTNAFTFAQRSDVLEELLEELESSQPALFKTAQNWPNHLAKAFRWSGEMREIGQSLADVGLEGGRVMFEGSALTWEGVEKTPFGQESIEVAVAQKRDTRSAAHALAQSMGDTAKAQHSDAVPENTRG